MDLKGIILSEMLGRERLISCDFTYMRNLKKLHKQTKQKQTHRYREQISSNQKGRELGVWVKGLNCLGDGR